MKMFDDIYSGIITKSDLFNGFVLVRRRTGVCTSVYIVKDGKRKFVGRASGIYLSEMIIDLLRYESLTRL